jgi:hypothetical protein
MLLNPAYEFLHLVSRPLHNDVIGSFNPTHGRTKLSCVTRDFTGDE